MLHDHVKSIDPGGTERKFATRIAGPDYCNAGRRAADGSGTWAPVYERPVIKMKTKEKGRGRDDVSFDLDEEEEEEDEEMEKERMQEKRKRHVEREKKMRSMREMIVYEARGVVYCPWMILSHSEEETLEEQILDCVREEWDEAEVTLAAHEKIEGRGRTLRMRREDSVYREIPVHLNIFCCPIDRLRRRTNGGEGKRGKRNTVKQRRSKEVWIPMVSTLSSVLSKLNRRWKLPRWLPACLLAGLRCSPARNEKEEGEASIQSGDETPGRWFTRGPTDSRAYPSRWLAKASRKHTGLTADARINAQIICRGYAPPPVVIDIWLSGTAIHQVRKSALYPWLARSYTSHPIPVKSGYTAALLPLSQSVFDVPRMEKSPLLANGYNHPPTHLSHMQFMQLGGHPGAGHTAILSPASLPHHLQAQAQARAEQGLKVNPNMTNMEALARSGTVWENCRAAYEDIVKHLER
ncbi:hypothetical protein G5I_14008 [Acromyrmex echinatior]|uniref:Uncharacterized protein n=1 Tax=Acromyrmex echinatior TaxID=103372 RepID=F4X6P0_ACREC|nr:hypothetical protein G5I_14008 [Acromyrmex echinatior]